MLEIKDIRWDRIYLEIEIKEVQKTETNYYLYAKESDLRIPLLCNNDIIRINITNVTKIKNQEMLPEGCWQLKYNNKDGDHFLVLSANAAQKLETMSRLFPYGHYHYAYGLTFESHATNMGNSLIIHSMYLRKNPKPRKEYLSLEADTLSNLAVQILTRISILLLRAFYFFSSKIHRKDKMHILLMSETKKTLAGNLLALDNWLNENQHPYKISHSFRETLIMPKHKVVLYWFALAWKMAKQDIIIVDDYAPIMKAIHLNPQTKLIQVWHAGLGFKAVGYARFGKEDSPRPFVSAHRNNDYVIVGSKNLIPIFSEVFGISEEKILPLGFLKMDDFLDPSGQAASKRKIYAKYPALQEKSLILFAPTYRGSGQKEAYYPTERLDWERIAQTCGDKYVFAIKMHPFIKSRLIIPEKYSDRIIDVSKENIDDLLILSQVLITDYSSVIYEYSVLKRPILFYAFDKEEYMTNRGFHWDYDNNAPGKICETLEEVLNSIEKQEYQMERLNIFHNFAFEYLDRNSCSRFFKFIDILLDKNTI